MSKQEPDELDLDGLNETEMVQLCRDRGFLGAHRGLGWDTLRGLLKGTVEYGDVERDPVDAERELMLYFQEEMREIMITQLKCGTDQNYFCPKCPPARVVACAVFQIRPDLRREGLYAIGRPPDGG